MKKRWDLFAHIVLIFFCCVVLGPLLWTLRTSFAPEVIAYQSRVFFPPIVTNYLDLFRVNNFGRFFLNSLIVSLSAAAFTVAFAAPSAYAIVRFRPGGSITRFFILSADLLPPVIIIIPLFALFRNWRLVNSLAGLTVSYFAFSIPFVLWMLIGFFEGVPKELEEAALLDGANRLTTFLRVVFPLAAPGIMAGTIFGFIISWNEFLFALILSSGRSSTIPVALAALQTQGGVMIGRVAAGVMLAIIPILALAPFIQKYLVKGLTLGAVKS